MKLPEIIQETRGKVAIILGFLMAAMAFLVVFDSFNPLPYLLAFDTSLNMALQQAAGSILVPTLPFIGVASYITGGIVVFLIAREYIIADRYTYFLVAAYLLYFPLAGINWQVFDVLSLFPTFFLLGYYSYIMDRRPLAFIFFIAAAMTFQVYAILVMIAGIAILLKESKHGFIDESPALSLSVVAISFIVVITTAFNTGFMFFQQPLALSSYGPLLTIVGDATYARPLFFIILVVPLITFAFFGPRVLPFALPYYALGIVVTIAGGSPRTLVAILDLVLPLSMIAMSRWIGRKVEMGIQADGNHIMRFAMFSLVILNLMVILAYFPFFKVLSSLLGL